MPHYCRRNRRAEAGPDSKQSQNVHLPIPFPIAGFRHGSGSDRSDGPRSGRRPRCSGGSGSSRDHPGHSQSVLSFLLLLTFFHLTNYLLILFLIYQKKNENLTLLNQQNAAQSTGTTAVSPHVGRTDSPPPSTIIVVIVPSSQYIAEPPGGSGQRWHAESCRVQWPRRRLTASRCPRPQSSVSPESTQNLLVV